VQLINELRTQPQKPQAELKTQARDDQDLRPESGLTWHLGVIEVRLRVLAGIGRQLLGGCLPKGCETVVARGLAGDDIVELADAGRAPHARIDRGHLCIQRIDIDQRLAVEAVDCGNDEVGRLGQIPGKLTTYPCDGKLRIDRDKMRREGIHFPLAKGALRQNMPPDVFGRDDIRVDERYRPYTRPCGDLGDLTADTATSDNSDTLLR